MKNMLIECPVCGKQISSGATNCPNCGEEIKKKMTKAAGAINWKDPVHLVGILFVAAVLLGLLFYLFCLIFGMTF